MLLPSELADPRILAAEPELATLAVLEVALEVAQGAIVAAHPGWARCQCSTHPPSDRCAQAGLIGCMAYELQEMVAEYLRGRPAMAEEP